MEIELKQKKHLFPLVGQWEIKERLKRIIQSGYVANAYLFHGQEGVGKEGFALEFAAMLNCTNGEEIPCGECSSCYKIRKMECPDVSLVFPIPRKSGTVSGDPPFKGFSEKEMEVVQQAIIQKGLNPYQKINIQKANNIPINSIREVRRNIYFTSHESRWKVVIIFQAEKMRQEAVNALLKVIEEPPERSVFILTTDNYNRILPTIKSRCQPFYFPPLKVEEIAGYLLEQHSLSEVEAERIALLSGGSLWRAQHILEVGYEQQEKFISGFVSTLVNDDVITLKKIVDTLENLKKNQPQQLNFIFQELLYWFHDLRLFQLELMEKILYFPGLKEFTSDFAQNYPDFDTESALRRVEKCIELVEKNVYIRLILFNMIFELQGLLRRGGEKGGM